MGTQPPPQKGGGSPKFSVHVYCGQTAGWIKMALGMEVSLSPGDFGLDGDPAPYPKRGRSPLFNFRQISTVPNGWMHQDATWYGGRPHPMALCVRWGPSPPPQKGGGSPKFSAHVYCDQTAGWIKMALGMEVGLGLGHIVLDGEPAPLPKKGQSPLNFRPIFNVANRLDESIWHLAWSWAWFKPHCARWGSSSHLQKGDKAPPHFYCR